MELIRTRILRRHGTLYDADEFYIHPNKN